MERSRSDRLTRSKNRRARHVKKYAALAAVLFVMFSGIYYIWNYGPSSDPHRDSNATPIEREQDQAESLPEPKPDSESGEEADSDSAVEPNTEPVPSESAVDSKVSLALVGDIMMGGRIHDLLLREGFDYPFRHVSSYITEADIAAGNLENPITDQGEAADKTYTFRTTPEAVPGMKASGFDVFNLANNHTLDFGLVGLRDTIRYLDEAELGRIGAGENEEEAFKPYSIEKNGVKVDFIGLTNVVPDTSWKADKKNPGLAETYNYTRALEAIEASAAQADLVVVMVHWGKERKDKSEKYMIENAHRYIDAGADLVIGSHPHVLQGLEQYHGKWIAYSLGNFIFTVSPDAATKQSAILQAVCDKSGDCKLKLVPVVTGIGQPLPASEEEAAAIFSKMDRLSPGVDVTSDGEVVPNSTEPAENDKPQEEIQ